MTENNWMKGMTEEIIASVKEEFATKFSELDTRIDETTQQNIVLEIKRHVSHNVINYTNIKGQHYQLKPLIEVMGSGEPAMIIGPTGSGKTRVTHAVRDALGCKHYAIRQVNKQTVLNRREVIDAFADSYLAGRTPIPCVACNKRFKFDHLLSRAQVFGASVVATGHYARIDSDPKTGLRRLRRARDTEI